MRVKLILLASLPVLLGVGVVLVFGTFPASGGPTGTTPSETAYKYFEHVKKREWDKAYSLTTAGFRSKIPLAAYSAYMSESGMSEAIISFTTGEATVEDSTAKIEVRMRFLNPGAKAEGSGSATVDLSKEAEGWRIEPSNPENYLSYKLSMLPPLVTVEQKGVSVSIKSIALYQEPAHVPGRSEVRLDVINQSGRTLRYTVPPESSRAASQGRIRDLVSGKEYVQTPALSTKGPASKGYESINRGGERGIVLAPGAEGTLYLNFASIPETVTEFAMAVSGFSFPDSGEALTVTFDKVPFRYDVVPPIKPSKPR